MIASKNTSCPGNAATKENPNISEIKSAERRKEESDAQEGEAGAGEAVAFGHK